MYKVFLCIATQHNLWLVAVAAGVCIPACLATFYLFARIPPSPVWRRWTWLGMTGLVSGSGIWTTHFIAMLAFSTGLPSGYAALATIGSLGVAVCGTTLGFAVASSDLGREARALASIAGGLLVGLAITLMHYVGMAGYRTAGFLEWDSRYIAGSVLIGATFAAAALFVTRPAGRPWRQLAAGGLLGLGIIGMHFTGMSAVTILPDSRVVVPSSLMSNGMMGVAAVAVSALIMITAVAGVAFDTASRNTSLRRLREALDVMPEGLAYYDGADRLVAWNNRYAELCEGSGLELAVGMPFQALLEAELVHGIYLEAIGRETQWLADRTAARRGEIPSLTQPTANGRWLRITERRTADGGVISVSVDITELKRSEAAMAEARDRAEELARRAEAAEAEAEAAAAVKAEFLANMSHELRTPLTSIIGFTTLAAGQSDLGPLTRDYIDRVGGASQALLCTVNDILDFSKLEAGQVVIKPQPIDFAALGRATLNLFTPQAGAKDLELVLDDEAGAEGLVVAIDPDRVRQVLLNLVGNAVKFTEAGSVTVRIRYVGERLNVEIIDTGGGIAPDKQQRLFKRFSQIDGSMTRTQGGTGLGLAICKGLIEAMGGEIGVESRMGEGSRFWFTVPAPRAELPAVSGAGDSAAARPMFDGVKVLVADDHPANRELARLFLSGVGAEVSEASDGEEAVRLAAARPFDVILMDVRMPRLDGEGALRRIRGAPGPNDRTPILAFTADIDSATVGRLEAMGFHDIVGKPVDPVLLIGATARAAAAAANVEAGALADAG